MNKNLKKVVLVYPKFLIQEGPKFNVPLSVLHLGSFIQSKGYRVKIIDGNIEENYEKLIVREAKNALCVGFSAMTDQVGEARRVARFLKNNITFMPPVVFGGVHATLFPKQTVMDASIDFAVYGEGEISFWNLLQALEKRKTFSQLRGVGFIKKGRYVLKEPFRRVDLNKLPPIDYNLLSPQVRKQFPENYVSFLSSRGCPHQCTFCINTVVKENQVWKSLLPEKVVEEIERLYCLYKVNKLFFWDENFFVDRERVERIIDLLNKKNIKIFWMANARADYFRKNMLDKMFLEKLKENGCVRLAMGAESGSKRMLDIYNKHMLPKQIIKSARECERTGIIPTYSYMIGAPGETERDIKLTLSSIKKVFSVCRSPRILGPQLFRPYPGSKLYQKCLSAGWKEPNNLEGWDKVVREEFMQTNPFAAPWIKNPKLVNIVWFYSFLLVVPFYKLVNMFLEYCRIYRKSSLFSIIGTVGVIAISSLGRLRYLLNYYDLPFEVKLFKKFRSVLSS